MGIIWEQEDIDDMLDEFGVDCIYYQAWQTPEQRRGEQTLDSNAVHGYRYRAPVNVRLIRTAVSNYIVNSPEGKVYKGGARFTLPPTRTINGTVVEQDIWDRVFIGDIVVVKEKPIRDYDILTKGSRDYIFAFDVTKLLSISYVRADKTPVFYEYGTDFTLRYNGVEMDATINTDGSVTLAFPAGLSVVFGDDALFGDFEYNEAYDATTDVANKIEVNWISDGPPDGQKYTVEFTSSPNYIIWDDLAKARATHDNNLPKMVMAVKRAFFNVRENTLDNVETRQEVFGEPDTHLDSEY